LGLVGLSASSLDQVGPLQHQRLADAAALLQVIAGADLP